MEQSHRTPLTKTIARTLPCLFFLLVVVYLFNLHRETTIKNEVIKPQKELADSASLLTFLSQTESTLEQTRKTGKAHQIFTINLPRDLAKQSLAQKTSLFIAMVLPIALKANEHLLHTRKKLIRLGLQEKQGHNLAEKDTQWIAKQAKLYSSPPDIPSLLQRVDIIPVSLTIAQAITESGWGTSRFALTGNALYGQHLAKKSAGKYILSHRGNVKVATFSSLYEATHSYIHNLNTSKAYRGLRQIRNRLRAQQKDPNGYSLAQGLRHYSALGDEYVTILRSIIKRYNLEALEKVTLHNQAPPVILRFRSPSNIDTKATTPKTAHFAPKEVSRE